MTFSMSTTPKVWSMKEVIDKMDFIKIKNSALQRQCQEDEKINHRLGENIYKKHIW